LYFPFIDTTYGIKHKTKRERNIHETSDKKKRRGEKKRTRKKSRKIRDHERHLSTTDVVDPRDDGRLHAPWTEGLLIVLLSS